MKRLFWFWLAMQLAAPFGALAQDQGYTFTTFAGRSAAGNVDGVGAEARFYDPTGIAADSQGNLYVVDVQMYTVRKLTPGAVVTTFAGRAGSAGLVDGVGASARFLNPIAVTIDGSGRLYVADNGWIRKITPDGMVQTWAGSGQGQVDGPGNVAGFRQPAALAADEAGFVYVADTGNHTIRKIDPAGVVTTVAGQAGVQGSADGAGAAARFNTPSGIAVDAGGNLYVADSANHTIRKITSAGVVTTLAGLAGVSGTDDGNGGAARFFNPQGMALDANGNLYVADTANSRVRKVTPGGMVTTIAGGFNNHYGLTVERGSGTLYVADTGNHTIKKITPEGAVTTFAGVSLPRGSVDGTGAGARFTTPRGAAVDNAGNVFIADTNGFAIRKITPAGVVTTWAGSLGVPGHVDGERADAQFFGASALAFDAAENLFVLESDTIRKIGGDGIVRTIAGVYGAMGASDGVGSDARFNFAAGLALDKDGNLYVADLYNHTIRRIDSAGRVTTPFGKSGSAGYADGVGNAARFNQPAGLAFDRAGYLYVGDLSNHVIRRISPAGEVTTWAGRPAASGSSDGRGIAATFSLPRGLAIDGHGNVFVADFGSDTIRKITPDALVTTIGGSEGMRGSADGIGIVARFDMPMGIAVDPFGNVFVVEYGSSLVRKGVVTGAKAPALTLQPVSSNVGAGAKVSFTTAAVGLPSPAYQWQRQTSGTTGFVDLADTDGLEGVMSATLTITATVAMNGDQFRCVVNNGILPVAASSAAALRVIPPPNFSSVAMATFVVGLPGSFAITAAGAAQFKIGAGRFPAWATLDSATGILSGTPPDATGAPFTFVVEASNVAVHPTSQSFTLNVNAGPAITAQPTALTANAGATAVLSAEAAGVAPVKLQWLKNGLPISNSATVSGATTGVLAIGNAQSADAGSYTLQATGVNGVIVSSPAVLTIVTAPTIAVQPLGQTVADGSRVSFTVGATSSTPISFQWYFNGQPMAGATAAIYTITAANPNWVGEYTVRVIDAKTSVLSQPAILNVVTGAKLAGAGQEVGADITHPNGKVYDQVLLTGGTATLKADAGQVMRISCIDLDDDIVQIEFSGAGSIHVRLDASSGPAAPLNYNQSVQYMKGHATLIIAGADETTNVSVFTVGRTTAINQALFRNDVTYDGVADIASITITSTNGKFGGVYTGNASYFSTKGLTGICAPGIQFLGPVVVGNISGADTARAVFILGSANDVRVAGGDLAQMNLQPVQVDGLTKVTFTAGATSHGVALPASRNRARLERNGIDLTDQIVVNPTP